MFAADKYVLYNLKQENMEKSFLKTNREPKKYV